MSQIATIATNLAKAITMKSLRSLGLGLTVQVVFLSTLCISISEAGFSAEYLSAIQEDAAIDLVAGEYDYDEQGANWAGTCSIGQMQSPIDINDNNTEDKEIPRIRFHNYNLAMQSPLSITNNGHSASMVLAPVRSGQRPSISGGMLPGEFEAQSVHFHWGSPDLPGSEHTIDGNQYDVEMHIVHKNKKYATMTEATAQSDGIAVLGVLINAVDRPSSNSYGLNRVLNALPSIVEYQSNATVTGRLTGNDLLGGVTTGEFFTYSGSLTTPDCAEAVTWTLFKNTINLPKAQVNKFFNLEDSRGSPLINNFRNVQSLNVRTVYARTLN